MRKTWKKAAAFAMALALVAGAAPANVGTGGLFGGSAITAKAATTVTTIDQLENASGSVVIGADIEYSEYTFWYYDNDVDIDLNGHTITLAQAYFGTYEKLTIRDSKGDGKILMLGDGVRVPGGSNLILDSGTLESNSEHGPIDVYGGTFTMNGGTITGQKSIWREDGSVIINGGNVNGEFDETGTSLSITGGIFNFDVTSLVNAGVSVTKIDNLWYVGDSAPSIVDLSTATVNLASDNSVASLTIGDDTITDLSGFDITYGTDDSHTATSVPTDAGTYYAYVTPKSTNTAYTGTAKSASFEVVASAAEESESFSTNTAARTYTGDHFKIDVTEEGDKDGFILSNDGDWSATITALYGETINKIELVRGYDADNYLGIPHVSSANATVTDNGNNTFTITNINASSVTLDKCVGAPYCQIKQVKVYFKEAAKKDISDTTIVLGNDCAVSSVRYGNIIVDPSEYDVTYGTDTDHSSTTVPTVRGTYYAYVTAKDTSPHFNPGTAKSEQFVVKTNISTAAVNLNTDNTVASITVGNDTITDFSDFNITYGTDDSHTATSVPTEPGTYYAYVTAKDTNTDYTGTAKSAQFVVKSNISTATVNLAADNSVASITVGNDTITDLSGFDITYGTDDSHTATAVPTDAGTYYAYVTAKDTNTAYTGTAKSSGFEIVASAAEESETIDTNAGSGENNVTYTGTHFKIDATYDRDSDGFYASSSDYAIVSALDGKQITKLELIKSYGNFDPTVDSETAEMSVSGNTYTFTNINATSVKIASDGYCQIKQVTIYYKEAAAPTISSASVTLGDDLALNFYVDGIADDTAAAEYTVNFTGACVDESSALTYNAAVGKYYATTHVYAKDIDKDITATLCKGNATVDTLADYSISKYLTAAESGADDKTKALITATKDFGNASSEYFYGTGSGYSDGFASYDPDTSAYAATFDSDAAKLSLVLDSKTAARLYVKGDDTGTASTISSTKADYPTYHEVTGLLPQNLADEQTINVGGTDYKFSALSWCSRVLTNGSASQKNINMAKAIVAYYEAAKAYTTVDVASVAITNAPTEALFVNSKGTLTATVSPDNATDKTVTWSSSDPDYVSINAETGEYTVMGKKGYGSATITATATNGTEDTSDDVTATCTITGKVTYTSLSAGTVLHVGDTFYAGKVYFKTTPNMSFIDSSGVITLVEDNGYYMFKRGSNGTMPNVKYKIKDNTDGVYIVSGSGTTSDRFTLAVHTK